MSRAERLCPGAVGRGRRRQAGARPLPRPAARRADRRRQYRRRFRASRARRSRPISTRCSIRSPGSTTRAPAGAGAARPGHFMAALEALGGETWFRLGDGDLATHVERTRRLARRREPVGDHRRFPPPPRHRARGSLPMSDDPVRTRALDRRKAGSTSRIISCGCAAPRRCARSTSPAPRPRGRIPIFSPRSPTPGCALVVICPSNPFISIDPILAVPGRARRRCARAAAPVVAVSPIIGGQAVKGPTAKMMAELGLPVDAAAVARHYGDLLDHLRRSTRRMPARSPGSTCRSTATRTLMETLADREALARAVLAAADRVFDDDPRSDLGGRAGQGQRGPPSSGSPPLLAAAAAPGAGPGDARRRAGGAGRRRRASPGCIVVTDRSGGDAARPRAMAPRIVEDGAARRPYRRGHGGGAAPRGAKGAPAMLTAARRHPARHRGGDRPADRRAPPGAVLHDRPVA